MNAREARWNHRPGRQHVIVGAGVGPCFVLAMSSRESQVDEVARNHGSCADEETQDSDVAYARVPKSEPTRYRDGWLSNN